MVPPSPSLPSSEARGLPRTSRNKGWPYEQIERLKALWNDGRLSASQMAQRLGISRGAVLGKAHRLGLCAKKPVKDTARAKAAPLRRMKIPPPPPPRQDEPLTEPPFVGVALMELPRNGCRYPQGNGPFKFCGQPVQEGSSYCEFHRRLCYVGVPGRRFNPDSYTYRPRGVR